MSALVSSQNANQPLATSSSSLTADNVQKFRPYFKAFTSRFVQSIVQARMGINISHQCEPVTEQSEWFNVFTDEVGEVSAEVRRNLKQSLPDIHAVNLDILLRTVDGDELQLEAWRLAIDTNDIPPEKVDVKSHFYHNLSTALKSVICAARCTPTYRRYVFSQGEDSYILCYRLYTGENISTLGEDAISLSLATLPSPVGRFMIDLRYRTKMEIERPPPTPPQYTGRTRAFSERLPSEPNLNSFDRNDQRRHSAREGLQVPCSARQMPSIHSQPVLTTMATSPPSESPAVYASSPNYSDVVGAFSTSPVSEYGDAQTDLDPSISRSRRSSRKSSDGEESDKERKKVQIQKFPFSNLLDRTSPAKTRLSQSALITQVSRLKSDKPSASCVSMTIEEEEEDSGRTTPKAEKSPMTEEEMMALPPLLQSFLAPQYFDFTSGDDSIPESEDSYVRVPFFGSASEPVADEQSTNGGLAATVDLFQYRAEKELSAIFEVENRSALDFQALIKGYAAEKDKFDQFVGSVQWMRTKMFKFSRVLSNKLVHDAVAEMAKKGKGYVPRRALLFVPGSSEKMLAKVPSLHADSVVLELEDGVAMTAKEEARKNVAKYLETFDPKDHKCQELSVRVNSVSSDLIFDDVREVAKASRLPQAFMVPKVDSVEDLATMWEAFRSAYGNDRITNTQTRLIIFIETARALLDMPRIVNAAVNLHRSSGFFKLDAVVFGYDDYCADIGATRTLELSESVYARQRFVAVCKAFNLQAIDCVFTDIKNLDALKEQSVQGRNWGFNGKQLIHPSQVDVTHAAFLPPPDRIKWAEELIAAFMDHEKSGKGAFIFRGNMIDRPVLLQAMNIVQTVDKVGKA